MATKAEEMKALNQIKKIVEGIGGADSYVGQAFSGCFEIAQENIENDFWNSMKDSLETARNNLKSERLMADTQRKQVADLKNELKLAKETCEQERERANGWVVKYREMEMTNRKNCEAFQKHEDKVEALQMEIIKLKARLFDMMEAQGA